MKIDELKKDEFEMVKVLSDVTIDVGCGRDLLRRLWNVLDHYTNRENYYDLLGKPDRRDMD